MNCVGLRLGYFLFQMALGAFRLFAGMALADNYYQNRMLIEKLDLLFEKEELIGKYIEAVYTRTKNLEALLAKPNLETLIEIYNLLLTTPHLNNLRIQTENNILPFTEAKLI